MPAQPTDAILRALFETSADLPLGFELFPPKTEEARSELHETAAHLARARPEEISVTMGAGGATRRTTHRTAVEIAEITGVPVMAHLTAHGLTREEIAATADGLWGDGITRILALRGDAPRDARSEIPESYAHATGLVAALRRRHDFEITVAAYPEKHPEAASLDADIEHLKQKLDAGASRAICQFVLNPERYGRFLEDCTRHGITAPIVPGVMPLEGWNRVRRFAAANGAGVPDWLDRLLGGLDGEPGLSRLTAMAATVEQLRRLIGYGAPAIHIYAMNRWELPLALAHMLGRPVTDAMTMPLD